MSSTMFHVEQPITISLEGKHVTEMYLFQCSTWNIIKDKEVSKTLEKLNKIKILFHVEQLLLS